MAPCKHDLEGGCADCAAALPAVIPRAAVFRDLGSWFAAQFDGDCSGCGGDVTAGEYIRADGEGGWLCGTCGHEDEEPAVQFCPIQVSGTAGTQALSLAAFLDQYREEGGY